MLDREALRAARQALREGGVLRGTALEYLANVLPERVCGALLPLLGEAAPREARRPARELEEELRRAPQLWRDEEPPD